MCEPETSSVKNHLCNALLYPYILQINKSKAYVFVVFVLLDFLLTVKAVPHECVIRT